MVEAGDSVASVLQKALSGKKFKAAVAARADNGALLDLSAPLPAGCAELAPVYADSPEGLQMIRHSTAHVMKFFYAPQRAFLRLVGRRRQRICV